MRVPPGRAGRAWLRHRLDLARRGADLLERKLRALHAERLRLAALARITEAEWRKTLREAETWLARGLAAGGHRALRLASDEERAVVTVTWTTTMGVRYPTSAAVEIPALPRPAVAPGPSALVLARRAYEEAVRAAARHAVAGAALRAVTAEANATRRRVRALRHHWIPVLSRALAALELGLEELERAEAVRRKAAVSSPPRR
jgi:V/A-type H+-transporting ATPase subunit D